MGLISWIAVVMLIAWLAYSFWPKSTLGSIVNFSVAMLGGLVGGIVSFQICARQKPKTS